MHSPGYKYRRVTELTRKLPTARKGLGPQALKVYVLNDILRALTEEISSWSMWICLQVRCCFSDFVGSVLENPLAPYYCCSIRGKLVKSEMQVRFAVDALIFLS